MLLLASLIASVSTATSFQDTVKVQDTVKTGASIPGRDLLKGEESIPAQAPVKARGPLKPADAPALVIVSVNVVPMDRERILPNQTVVVRDGRIERIGAEDSVPVPPGATVIEGRGRYLMPGLVDMHVHLTREIGAGGNFSDGPLYLANGVTTVLNLRGDSTSLDWRARVKRGEMPGPTIYTAGEFVNEPRVKTGAEAEQEVKAQAAAGVDVIKFREVLDLAKGAVLTTTGLDRATYLRLNDAARAIPIPLIGHTPNNLGFEAALEARQSIAHVGQLMPSYFWPRETARFKSNERLARWSVIALGIVAGLGWIVAGVELVRRGRRGAGGLAVATSAVATLVLLVALAGGRVLFQPDFTGQPQRIGRVTAAGIGCAVGALTLLWVALAAWGRAKSPAVLTVFGLGAAAALVLASSAVGYWVPLVRRSTESGQRHLAQEIARAGIWVATTMEVYRSDQIFTRPEVQYVSVPNWWNRFRSNSTPARVAWSQQLLGFLQQVVGALARERVPLLAGTDAMGWAYIIPGFSLQDELGLMSGAGLTPYQVLSSATSEPARFLQTPSEFGTVEVGRRADLLLVERNPLEDMTTLRKPAGLAVRGRWYEAEELARGLVPAPHPSSP